MYQDEQPYHEQNDAVSYIDTADLLTAEHLKPLTHVQRTQRLCALWMAVYRKHGGCELASGILRPSAPTHHPVGEQIQLLTRDAIRDAIPLARLINMVRWAARMAAQAETNSAERNEVG